MPAQTVMQVRRDTAANWSSTNPVLANGEIGYDTTNKLFKVGDGSTAWNSLKVMAQHDTGSAARPLLTGAGYLTGSGLVLSGLAGNYASTPDSAALSVTGDIDIKVKCSANDWTPANTRIPLAKLGVSGNQRSYWIYLLSTGGIQLGWSTDGTATLDRTSSVATGFSDGATKWIRATMDVNDGAGNRVIKFYTSDDGTTWTQLGTTRTDAGTTSIYDSTAALNVGSQDNGQTTAGWDGTIHRVIIQSAYDTADNTTSLQFDANFETQTADALAFTESSSNTATVTINTTRYTWGAFGSPIVSQTTRTTGANFSVYTWFQVTAPTVVDMVSFDVTSAPASTSTLRAGIYAADANLQPTGAPIVDAGTVTVNTGVTGVYHKQFTPVTIQPGVYLTLVNTSVTFTTRAYRVAFPTGIVFGASSFISDVYLAQTLSALPSSPSAWNTRGVATAGIDHYLMWRTKAA